MTFFSRFRKDANNPEYPGKITRVNRDGTYDINYDDGDVDKDVPPSMVRTKGDSINKKKTRSMLWLIVY